MAKISIVKGYQILIFTSKSPVSGIVHFLENALKLKMTDNFGYARNGTSGSGNLIWDHFTIITFARLLLWSGLRFALGPSESVFWGYFFKATFPIEIPIAAKHF